MFENRKPIFLSYASKDEDEMQRLADYLEDRGIPCWYAKRDIPPGDNYNVRIAADLPQSEGVVVLVTKEAGESTFVPKEIDLALRNKKVIIPLLIDVPAYPKSLELMLCNVQYVNMSAFASNEDAMESVATDLEQLFQRRTDYGNMNENETVSVKRPVILKDRAANVLYHISSDTTNRLESVYEAPPGYETMQQQLLQARVICLYQPQHVGKYSTAISLLRNIGVDKLFEWSKELTISNLLRHPLKAGSGFILELESCSEFFRMASEHELERYVDELMEKDAYLVIVSKDQPHGSFFLERSFLVHPPQNSTRLLSRFANVMEQNEEKRLMVMNWLISDEAAEIIPKIILPRDAGLYLRKIKQLIAGDMDRKQFIQSLDFSVQERVKAWFNQQRSLRDKAFYLALGIFEGSTFPDLVKKSIPLWELFIEHNGQESAVEEFQPSRDEYLMRFHASVQTAIKHTFIGRDQVNTVHFLFPEDTPFIWSYLWLQYPAFHSPFIKWFHRLLREEPRFIEERVIQLIVHLLNEDPDTVRKSIIWPWANSSEPKQRVFAVRILEKLAEDEDRTHQVFILMKTWAKQTNNERLQWTAVILLGTKAGCAFMSESLRLLKEMSRSRKLSYSVIKSYQSLGTFVLHSTDYETIYFCFWIEWFRELEVTALIEVIAYAQSVFMGNPMLFFKTDTKWQITFWDEFLSVSYQKSVLRRGMESLIQRWIAAANGNPEDVERLARLLNEFQGKEGSETQSRLLRFINNGVQQEERLYRPLRDKLQTMSKEHTQ